MKRFLQSILVLCLVAFAQTALAVLPKHGTCGLYAEVPNNYESFVAGGAIWNLGNGDSQPANIIGVVDFRAKTIDFSVNLVTNKNGIFEFSELTEAAATWSEVSSSRPWSTVTIKSGALSGVSFNLLPVSNNSTFHVRGAPGSDMERLHGVCQMQ